MAEASAQAVKSRLISESLNRCGKAACEYRRMVGIAVSRPAESLPCETRKRSKDRTAVAVPCGPNPLRGAASVRTNSMILSALNADHSMTLCRLIELIRRVAKKRYFWRVVGANPRT